MDVKATFKWMGITIALALVIIASVYFNTPKENIIIPVADVTVEAPADAVTMVEECTPTPGAVVVAPEVVPNETTPEAMPTVVDTAVPDPV